MADKLDLFLRIQRFKKNLIEKTSFWRPAMFGKNFYKIINDLVKKKKKFHFSFYS
jgi:hypothetical protein